MLPTICKRTRDLSPWFDEFDSFFTHGISDKDQILSNFPRVDIHEDEENYYIDADLPGLGKDDVHINIEQNVLKLSGEREDRRADKKEGYCRHERQTGYFERSFQLGSNVDFSKSKAEFEQGMLKIVIPKKEEAKLKKLNINSI